MFLSYPLTEIDVHHWNPHSLGLCGKIVLRLDLPKQNVGQRRKFRSILGTFWGHLPHVGVVSPKTRLHYKAHFTPYHYAKYRANLISGSEDYPYH